MEIVPKISVLKLAEYMVGDVRERANVLSCAMQENKAAAIQYSRGRQEVVKALQSRDPALALADAAQGFREREYSGDWDERDLTNSADALDEIRHHLGSIDLGERFPESRDSWLPLRIGGIEISVVPDLIVRTEQKIGLLKFRFGKTRAMEEKEGEYASTLLRVYLRDLLSDHEYVADHRRCQVVDAFSGNVFTAPRAFQRRMDRLTLGCREFAAQWQAEIARQAEEEIILPAASQPSALN